VRCAILGDPVDHSLSPVIHRAAYRALDLPDWRYDAVHVPAGGLAGFVDRLDPAQWRGLSLTMPLKREAVPLLSSYDEWVAASGACNTMVLEAGGTRHGLNTDVTGALMVLSEQDTTLERAVVLGGGATATSMLLALAELGMRHATLVVRDPDRTGDTVHAVVSHQPGTAVEVLPMDAVGVLSGDILVSTVPASAQVPELLAAVAEVPLVFDVVYDPWPTPIAKAAEQAGVRVVSGLDLLAHQAALQVELMTGDQVSPQLLRRAALAELSTR
jgi:shikimate dehydrogenase